MSETMDRGAAVLPLAGEMAAPARDVALPDPLRMLAEGTGMLVTWEPWSDQSQRWGAQLGAASGLARQN